MLDIKHYACSGHAITDDVKHQLLENREPEKSFKFPPKQYAMKISKTGYVNWYLILLGMVQKVRLHKLLEVRGWSILPRMYFQKCKYQNLVARVSGWGLHDGA